MKRKITNPYTNSTSDMKNKKKRILNIVSFDNLQKENNSQMITENNKALDLDNGDTGIIITLEGSDIPYFLIAKASNLHPVDAKRVEDKILKVGKYLLYPLRMLDLKKTVLAYAITIHKSQGSGYDNILIVLPKKKGHPLLNRQIVYTAITRTKGPTYIISSIDRINEAIENITYRYTQIFD